jgi:hypothetical protein
MREANIQHLICTRMLGFNSRVNLINDRYEDRYDLLHVIIDIEATLRGHADRRAIICTFAEVEAYLQERELNSRVLRDVHSLKLWQWDEG